MGFLLFVGGLIIVGASLYGIYGNRTTNGDPDNELTPTMPDGRRFDFTRYEPIPPPISVKPFLILITLFLFGMCLYTMHYIVNYSETVAGKFWLFLVVIGLFGFGCYFVSLVGKADEKHKQKSDFVILKNENLIKERKQAVQIFNAEREEAARIELERKKTENEMRHQETIETDYEIIKSNTNEAYQAQIPVTAFTRIRTDDFATQVATENLKKVKKVEREDEKERARDKNEIEREKAHNVLNASERAEYARLKSEYDDTLRNYKRELAELEAKTTLTPAEKSDVEHLKTVIKETEDDKNALRRNFLRSSNGEETPRLA